MISPRKLAAVRRCAAAAVALTAVAVHAGPIEVIFTNLPGHPTSAVPEMAGLSFNVGVTSQFDRPFSSPDGRRWIIKARLGPPSNSGNNEVVLVGAGLSSAVVLREGWPTGAAGEVYGTFSTSMGINDAGRFVLSSELTAPTSTAQAIIAWNGAAFTPVARQGGPAPGTGGGQFSAALDSAGILNDPGATPYFRAGAIVSGARAGQSIWYRGGDIVVATADPGLAPLEQLSDPAQSWETLGVNRFRMDGAGRNWIGFGDLLPATSPLDQVLTVSNRVKSQAGSVIPGDPLGRTVAATIAPNPEFISADGRFWMARGGFTDEQDFVLRSGLIVAATDAPITLRPGEGEQFEDGLFAPTFFLNLGNSAGDFVIGGVTSAADPAADVVVVFNNQRVVVREGDPIDLNANGLADDDAFVGVFNNDDAFLTDDNDLYFTADIRNAAGALTGQGFFRIAICKADFDGSGAANSSDISAYLSAWLSSVVGGSLLADSNHDDATNSADISAFLAAWLEAVTGGC